MNPVKHPSNNTLCHSPKGWDDRGGTLQLPALHATKGTISGITTFVTFWQPTADELSMLLSGGQVQLTCIGGQPACNVSALPPNEQQLPRILLPN